ncbi:hypothetical protein BKA93DRAFT_825464 [Sparassis latifolia]
MLARPSVTASCQCSLARSSPGLKPVAARSNSSLASESSSDGQTNSIPHRKRSIPIAGSFGNILIPEALKLGSLKNNASSRLGTRLNSARPDISWLGVDEFGGSLARRLAQAKAESRAKQPEGQASPASSAIAVNARGSSHKLNSYGTRVTADTRRQWEGATKDKVEEVHAKPSRSEARPPGARQRQTDQRVHAEAVEVGKEVRGKVQKAGRDKPSHTKAPAGSMEIQTTDLDKLFGAPSTAQRSTAPRVAALELQTESPPAQRSLSTPRAKIRPTMSPSMALRVQRTLENSGGDYSRYLPQIQGLNEPEQRTPLGIAQLVMARKTEAGPRMRRNALGIVQKLIVNEVNAGPSP